MLKLLCCWSVQIQKMVISGGDFKPDTLKTKEMVSLLLDDDEMKSRCKSKLRRLQAHCVL